jgi:hypothetical protein
MILVAMEGEAREARQDRASEQGKKHPSDEDEDQVQQKPAAPHPSRPFLRDFPRL